MALITYFSHQQSFILRMHTTSQPLLTVISNCNNVCINLEVLWEKPLFFNFILQETNFKEPLRIFSESELDSFNLHYYSAEVHRAAFVLPRFARKALDEIIANFRDEVNNGDR